MIYEINNEYYIRISPLRYKKIKMELIDDDVKIVALPETIEANGQMIITQINFQQEKEIFKNKLIEESLATVEEENNNSTTTRKYKRNG